MCYNLRRKTKINYWWFNPLCARFFFTETSFNVLFQIIAENWKGSNRNQLSRKTSFRSMAEQGLSQREKTLHVYPGGGGGGGGYSVRKLLRVCRGPLKIGPKKIEGKMVFWGQKDRILRGFVPKRSFLCWWMRKNTPKRSSLVPRGSKKGVKTAAHMYHPSYREYPPPPPPPRACVMPSVIGRDLPQP